jgi:hypothetical protein
MFALASAHRSCDAMHPCRIPPTPQPIDPKRHRTLARCLRPNTPGTSSMDGAMPAGEHGRTRDLQRALRGYLSRHPGAADGIAGIRLWWLPSHLQGVSDRELRGALEQLVRRNEMQRTALFDGTELYASLATVAPPVHRDAPPRPTRH